MERSEAALRVAARTLVGMVLLGTVAAAANDAPSPLEKHLVLRPTKENPRNSEGAFVRLKDGRILFVYSHFSGGADEAATWSRPILCMPEDGYFVVNNDRVIQLKSGRLVVPAAQHHYVATPNAPATGKGEATCFVSDDSGATWHRSRTTLTAPPNSRAGFQEPAVVELKDGRLLMLIRIDLGFQYRSISADGGQTWTPAEPTSLASPLSPCSIKRVPKTGDLMVIWNDHRNTPAALKNRRTPFSVAISSDEGNTWRASKTLESHPNGHYCYTAILFLDDRVLLAYDGLAGKPLEIASFPLDWLYH